MGRTLLTVLAAIALILSLVAVTTPVMGAHDDAPGNNGTIKVHDNNPGEPDPEVKNQPHVCQFDLHFFFADAGQQGAWWIKAWPPTSAEGPSSDPEGAVLAGTYLTDENGEYRDPEAGYHTLPDGHYKLYWEGATNPGGQTPIKHKVFWVDCEEQGGELGDITIVKEADDDATASFGFTADWDADGFSLMDGQSEMSGDLAAGDYVVTEMLTTAQVEAGWSLAEIDCGEADVVVDLAAGSVTITLAEGESVTCTFTNELEAVGGELGAIIVAKATSVGTDADFAFTFEGEPFSLGGGDVEAYGDLAAGEYTVVELIDELDDDWSLASIECVIVDDEGTFPDADATIDMGTGTTTINLAAGQTVLCLYLNEMEQEQAGELGSITILKTAVGANAATTEFDFTTTESVAGSVEDFTLLGGGSELFGNLAAGTYTFTEASLTGWRLAGITCTAGGSGDLTSRTATVTLEVGASVTCVFTNLAVSGGVLPGQPSQPAQPGQAAASPSPRGGVLGGTLPDTATDESAAPTLITGLLGLLMLGGMTVLGTRTVAEARRRR